jgi:hypothetical protein|tara:strand:+ start:3838 stop:4287 length:450 start_codon:yes stop_codon:yes gene_type:complete
VIRLWSYEDCSCGKAHQSVPITSPKIPKTIKCECGKRIGWGVTRTNGIHATLSTMNYGRFDPQFGCVVESYGHKKQLMKELGLIDIGGPEKFDDIEADGERMRPGTEADPSIVRADSMEEIMGLIPEDQIDRKRTGKEGRPMLDCFTKL